MKTTTLLYGIWGAMFCTSLYAAAINCNNNGTCVTMLAHYESDYGGFMGCVDASTCTCNGTSYPCVCEANSDCGYNYCCVNNRCQPCSPCTYNCSGCGSWSAAGTGYEKKTTCACNGTCDNRTISYRCAAGYWGSSTNGTSGCVKCETGTTSAAGSISHNACCYPSGYSYTGSDTSGSYTVKHNGVCCWS